jgi:hypothetical protein
MKRRDFLIDHLIQKNVIEDIMKSLAWSTVAGAMFSMSMSALKSKELALGLGVFFFFIFITTFTMMYVALHIVIPLNNAMYPNDPFWEEKAKNNKGIKKIFEILKVYFTKKGVFYLLLCISYFCYSHYVARYIANKL